MAKPSTFDYLNVVNGKIKMNQELEENFSSCYSVFLMNRILSNDIRLLPIANLMNTLSSLKIPPYSHFKAVQLFYKEKYKSKVVYIKYASKKDSIDEEIEMIQKHFQINNIRASEYHKMISLEELEEIKQLYKEENDSTIKKKK